MAPLKRRSWRDAIARVPRPLLLLALVFVAVGAWTWSWPDHPLIPDEAVAKVMVHSVDETGAPFAREPITDYRSGTFAADRYGGAYRDHDIAYPPTSIGTSYEQGLFGIKLGRLITLAIGAASIAYLATRLAGPWAGFFGGTLFLLHPATLYFHQSYFSNSGGTAWFLAAIALLEASRRHEWLARLSVVAAGIAVIFRVEYALGFVVLLPLAAFLLRGRSRIIAYYATVALVALVLWNLNTWVPALTSEALFTEQVPLEQLVAHPIEALETLLNRYQEPTGLTPEQEWQAFVQNVNDYFPFFFPLTAMLAVLGLLARVPNREALWVYLPLGLQSLMQAYAILPALVNFDFSYVSWLESSIVRYFLVSYAFTALLGGVALAALVEFAAPRLGRLHVRGPVVGTLALAALVASASVTTAMTAEHGVAWANERRAWFDDIEAAAVALDEKAVFVGKTPGKVIFERPLMNPENVGWDYEYATFVATDLMTKGHRVFALEPWYWNDHGHSMEKALQYGGRTYWTDTGVQVDCTCGEFARFYELHFTNASLTNVARVEPDAFVEDTRGLRTAAEVAMFYPERFLHIDTGLARTGGVSVRVTHVDGGHATYEAGYWNLFLDNPKNRHPLVGWTTNGTGATRVVTFDVTGDEIVNGAFYIAGPPGLLVTKLEVLRK